MSPSAAPPSPKEIQRKLSVHSVAGKSPKPKPSSVSISAISGTESDSDSMYAQEVPVLTPSSYTGPGLHGNAKPLSSIAERRSGSGEDSEDEDDDEDDSRDDATRDSLPRGSVDETVIKTGYLWKKGERRKTWKKRWFVLRPAHLAYYKTSAEYKLLRLVELSEVHSCTTVALKKHENTFVLVSQSRTYYLQAQSQSEVEGWISAIEDARQTLMATSTQTSITSPIPIPGSRMHQTPRPYPIAITPSPPNPSYMQQNVTSSDSEDASPRAQRTVSLSSQQPQTPTIATSQSPNSKSIPADRAKMILSGYLMKCDSKRRNWRKRWFILTGEKLMYTGSHMDSKPHRQFPHEQILDALECDFPARGNNIMSPTPASFTSSMPDMDGDSHTFKIVTTKRTLLLCAPSEDDEIKWLGAVHALIARRSGAIPMNPSNSTGGVPNPNVTSISASPEGNNPANTAHQASASGGSGISASGGSSGGGSGGIKSKPRRLSAASGSGPDRGATDR
ncbi:hypothetical protein EYR40_008064 [Pleurotus pulmonarius]|nr:hypothetical protein EYR40_008064 [Pleurotus pulmonarius]